MAKNTGKGARRGAQKNRTQLLDPRSGLWSIFTLAGELVWNKKSPGPAKGVRKGQPRKPKR